VCACVHVCVRVYICVCVWGVIRGGGGVIELRVGLYCVIKAMQTADSRQQTADSRQQTVSNLRVGLYCVIEAILGKG
jgi:hypothetical protein